MLIVHDTCSMCVIDVRSKMYPTLFSEKVEIFQSMIYTTLNLFSFNIGLFISFVLGLTAPNMDLGQLDSSALVAAFPIIGSLLQIIILPWVYDSPASLGIVLLVMSHENCMSYMV